MIQWDKDFVVCTADSKCFTRDEFIREVTKDFKNNTGDTIPEFSVSAIPVEGSWILEITE